jgi:hypothetical protein
MAATDDTFDEVGDAQWDAMKGCLVTSSVLHTLHPRAASSARKIRTVRRPESAAPVHAEVAVVDGDEKEEEEDDKKKKEKRQNKKKKKKHHHTKNDEVVEVVKEPEAPQPPPRPPQPQSPAQAPPQPKSRAKGKAFSDV